jgi:hypothetical protein
MSVLVALQGAPPPPTTSLPIRQPGYRMLPFLVLPLIMFLF